MRKGSEDKQNAYPCIFMKKKRLPEDKVERLKQMDESNHNGVWVMFNENKANKQAQ